MRRNFTLEMLHFGAFSVANGLRWRGHHGHVPPCQIGYHSAVCKRCTRWNRYIPSTNTGSTRVMVDFILLPSANFNLIQPNCPFSVAKTLKGQFAESMLIVSRKMRLKLALGSKMKSTITRVDPVFVEGMYKNVSSCLRKVASARCDLGWCREAV